MEKPMVSIIIPTYNRQDLILVSLDSIFRQTFSDYEVLIVDDASTDNTEQVIKDLNHPRVRYFKLDKNSGQCIARNFGMKNALGQYVAFLDSDDEWLEDKLEKQLEIFEKGSDKLGAVYGYTYLRNAELDTQILLEGASERGYIHDRFLEAHCPPTPSLFLVKKEALDKVNGFDEELLTFVDLDLWIRISEFYEFDMVEKPMIIKNEQIGGDQYVSNFEKRYRGLHLFMEKWTDYLREKKGNKGVRRMKKHLVYALAAPLLQNPPDNLQKYTSKIIGLLIQIRSTRIHLYSKALAIMFFGPGIVGKVRELR